MTGDDALRLAQAALRSRQERAALPTIGRIAAQGPPHPALLHYLALLHRAVGDLAPAIACLDQAISLGAPSARLLHARAQFAFEAGLASVDWYEQAHRLAPLDSDILLGLASSLLADRGREPAETLLSATLAENPGWIAGHNALIRIRFATNDPRAVFATLDKAIASAPADHRLHLTKIYALHRASEADATLQAVSDARRRAGDGPELLGAAAMAITEFGTVADAERAFASVDPFSETNLAIHWLRHLLRAKRPESVLALASGRNALGARDAAPYVTIARRLLGHAEDQSDWVQVIDFGEDWPPLRELRAELDNCHDRSGQPLDQSVRGGSQTDGPLLSRITSPVRALRQRLTEAYRDYRQSLPDTAEARALPSEFRLAGSWSVRLNDSGFHEPHVHPDGLISSAFYVDLPPFSDSEGHLELGRPQSTLNTGLDAERLVEPKAGRLVLFPSTMWHGTRPFRQGQRLTVAFDIA